MVETLVLVSLFLTVFGHIIKEGRLEKEGKLQRSLHKLYAVLEPSLLRFLDRMMTSEIIGGTRIGRVILKILSKILWFLPHGVVTDYIALEHLPTWIDSQENSHIAIGPCVCKKALGVHEEPYMTDMTILYGAEIYKEAFPEEYRVISKDEALRLLKEFETKGLVHTVFACFRSGKWTFVICNCDPKYCIPLRAYLLIKEGIYPGPLVAKVDIDQCEGIKSCGKCLERCPFGAVEERSGKSFVNEKCMGCGICIESCPKGARSLVRREHYKPKIIPMDIMYPGL